VSYGVGNTHFFFSLFTTSVNALLFQNRSQKAEVYLVNLPDFEIQMSKAELRSYFFIRHITATNKYKFHKLDNLTSSHILKRIISLIN